MNIINRYLLDEDNITEKTRYFVIRKRIECKDGFSISVQANDSAYCLPRDTIGPWTHVECGFPTETPDIIMEYCEEKESPTETVYGYVPVELVEKLVLSHGGIV